LMEVVQNYMLAKAGKPILPLGVKK
jgi:hypothetical protein